MKRVIIIMIGVLLLQGCQSFTEKEISFVGNEYLCIWSEREQTTYRFLSDYEFEVIDPEFAVNGYTWTDYYVKIYPEQNYYFSYNYKSVFKIEDQGNTLVWYPGGVIDLDDLKYTNPMKCKRVGGE